LEIIIMKLSRILLVTGFAAVLALSSGNVVAQGQGGGRQGGRNFDPAQMRQRIMDRERETLGVTDDSEWKALEPLVGKVLDARMEIGFGGRGFGGPRNRGGNAGDTNQPARPSFGTPNPAAEALQKAIDSKDTAAIKTKLEAYRADIKTKEAKLEKAQDDLKKFLTPQQEAAAVLGGLLK
jgi:hypothetical protein